MPHEAHIEDGPGQVPARRSESHQHDDVLVIDCDRCSMRGIGCGDCVVTVLLGGPPYGVPLSEEERRALDVLAASGLVPPLRMVESMDSHHPEPS